MTFVMEHKLQLNELMFYGRIAGQQNKSPETSIRLIEAFIFDVAGKHTRISNIMPIDKFEQAATDACNWFVLSVEKIIKDSPQQEFFSFTFDGQEVNNETIKQKMREAGIPGI